MKIEEIKEVKGIELMEHLLSYLLEEGNDIQANYFQLIMNNILEHNYSAVLQHLYNHQEYMTSLVKRSNKHSIC
jgi:hypothetical protein